MGSLLRLHILRKLVERLIDIHGQHEHQELMDERLHLPLLDQFGGEEIAQGISGISNVYKHYDQTIKQVKILSENEQKMAHRLDLIQFQFDEIQNANLKLNEDEELY